MPHVAVITRFAPSPTGHLHLGHGFAALFAERIAREAAGRFLLRIEDIDLGRCRPEYEAAIFEDLDWLGLAWEEPVRRQSDQQADYAAALSRLDGAGLLYPCFCTRREIRDEVARAGQAPHTPEGPRYPGTCRRLTTAQRAARKAQGRPYALRLDTVAAIEVAGPLTWHDRAAGTMTAEPDLFGDAVLARKDIPTSYHLAVTVDDHLQGVTIVTRGTDLFSSTHVHRLLQALLDLDVPDYHHHGLIMDAAGQRVAKRDNPLTLRQMREAGRTPQELRAMIEAASPDLDAC